MTANTTKILNNLNIKEYNILKLIQVLILFQTIKVDICHQLFLENVLYASAYGNV